VQADSDVEPLRLRVGAIIDRSRVNGPGCRTVVWVQGCTLACPGCWNKELWPHSGGDLWDVDDLACRLLSVDGVEGVTFSGGEPLQQPEALHELINQLQAAGRSIFIYSGYELDELNPIQSACIEACDVAVVGRYVEAERDMSMKWKGSRNQRVLFPSGRYSDEDIGEDAQEFEVHINKDGTYKVTGFPSDEMMEKILEEIGQD